MVKVFTRIRKVVARIPLGRATTYGAVAKFLGIRDVRLVGFALWGNQDLNVPCHRVVKKDGFLAEKYSLGGRPEQRRRLEKEGIEFVGLRQADLKKHFWNPS